jgi:Fuc2NAc and GlcNAc transferase
MTHPSLLLMAVVLISLVATGLFRSYAVRARLLDYPGERSSHTMPTPRGGGVVIVAASLSAIAYLGATGKLDTNVAWALVGGGILIACIGFLDDRGSVSVRKRIVVHLAAAVWAVCWLGGLSSLQIGDSVIDLGVAGDLLSVLAIVWVLNLFNFMDGIDGIAASEAAFITAAGGILGVVGGDGSGLSVAAFAIAAASLGFLAWNWPPAKLFMGDAGSGYLGYVIAVLALASGKANPAAPFVWLTLGAVFFVDASLTLGCRFLRGKRVYEAHRSHAYQVLSRRWSSHLKVTALTIAIDVLLLLPLGYMSIANPAWAAPLAVVTLGLMGAAAFFVVRKEQ